MKNSTNQFVESSYFDEVRLQMKENGFPEFATVTINSEEVPYHVKVDKARDTRLFFWVEKKTIIIQACFCEDGCLGTNVYVRGYWKIYLYIETGLEKKSLDAFQKCFDPIEGFSGGPTCYGNDKHGFHACIEITNISSSSPMNPCALASGIKELVGRIYDVVHISPFQELQVTDFPPHYTFPGCEKNFWKKFDKRNLRALVKRPWGSRGLER